MIFSAKFFREIGVWPAGTFLSDLFCCSGVSGCTHENSSGQMESSLCAVICCFRPFVIFDRADDEFDFIGGFQMRDVFQTIAFDFAAAGAFQIHDAADTRINFGDVVRAAGLDQNGEAVVAE